ncbi:hypothetical protein PL706_00770 [Bifidobacterium catenulatum]|uniref:hypothetical protein n=1 Tax=Bifidobacterium catenulatum TaxID=1686 RepID=UPI00232EEBA6|nr:hypothetical protein [Bifidobacterium catenulatum]MDB1140189.1 hypothetical protein [Bifidobacterium catenulatum]MDB1145430.1 hypothetical protein [Bifidobacterium catenulatum]MDB1157446.1 hypothetical protein [Bifidobacterium catenulatum]
MWSVAEPLAGVNKIAAGEVVQLDDAPPAVGAKDAAERFATLDDAHAATLAVDPLAAVDVSQ